jgi:hypothetical protein
MAELNQSDLNLTNCSFSFQNKPDAVVLNTTDMSQDNSETLTLNQTAKVYSNLHSAVLRWQTEAYLRSESFED